MNGDVLLGSHAGSSIVNAGTLNGKVSVGALNAGAGQVFDSTLGTVSGAIFVGPAGGIVIAGQTGGSVFGGAGNDMLYANSTLAAADNHARTNLDGGAGINALYGGSGFNTFIVGDASGGYNQIWGGASRDGQRSRLHEQHAFICHRASWSLCRSSQWTQRLCRVDPGGSWTGSGTYEDSIVNVPNVIGSAFGDVIQADNGADRIAGGGKADQLYAGSSGSSQDIFVYNGYGDSNTVTGYDTIVGFKAGTDKIDLSAFNTNGAHLALSTGRHVQAPLSRAELPVRLVNAATDLALIVNTSVAGGSRIRGTSCSEAPSSHHGQGVHAVSVVDLPP